MTSRRPGSITMARSIPTGVFATILTSWTGRIGPCRSKSIPEIESFPLPRDVSQPASLPYRQSQKPVRVPLTDSIPQLQDLARILYFSAGITKTRTHPGGELYFRAAACTGALYEIELYAVTGDLPGLEAGVYHFNPRMCR